MALVGAAQAQPSPDPITERDLNQPLISGTSEVFFPHQFRDYDGKLKGFANDITDGVARVMNLHVERAAIANSDMATALRSGRVDFLQFWSETEERRAWAEFSVPVVGGIETVAVVRRQDTRIHRLADLDGKRVAVGQRGTIGWKYLVERHPTAVPVFTETSEQFLRMLSAGEVDAAVMSRLTAASMIDRYGLKNLKVLEDRIPGTNYDVRYCFTVRKGDSQLLARLNEGLAILHRSGEYDQIYNRWFGRYEAPSFRPVEVVSYVAAALGLGLIAATWGFVRQRHLSRRIARQAAELAEQRSLLAALHDKHPLATVIFELEGGAGMMVSANEEAVRLFAIDADLLPRGLTALELGPSVREYFTAALNRVNGDPGGRQWEARVGQRLMESVLVPLGPAATVQRVCVLSNDVTHRRLMDQELAQSRRMRALGELVGGIAHEFNNLLTPILMTTSYAQLDATLSGEVQANFKVIDDAAHRAAELTRRLLTFGRKAHERAEPVRVADVVENCFGLLRPTVDRRIQWSFDRPTELPPVTFNATDLHQVIFNLVINARDTLLDKLQQPHSAAWVPRLTVRVGEVAGEAHRRRLPAPRVPVAWQRITVEDNGCGIAPDVVDRIFEPFFTTKTVGRGTGLGLATVWHLVTEAGGDVLVETEVNEGTKLHVLLPRWSDGPPAQPIETKAPATSSKPVRARVLLLEDEPLVSDAAVAILRRAGFTVAHQPDGAAGWSEYSARPGEFDLLLADMNMPRVSGLDFVRQVRQTPFGGRIVIMSGRISEAERRALAELRVDHVLPKPFTAAELVATLEAVWGGGKA